MVLMIVVNCDHIRRENIDYEAVTSTSLITFERKI